jgi:hypothetical protein
MSAETGFQGYREGQWASFVCVDPPYGFFDKEWDKMDARTLQYFAYTIAASLVKKHCFVIFNGWQVIGCPSAVGRACNTLTQTNRTLRSLEPS